MKLKLTIALILSCSAISSVAQRHYEFMEFAIERFSQNRIQPFEQISFAWNMVGDIQADLNNGINYILEGQPARAQVSFDIVIKKDRLLWEAYYYRGIARRQQAQYDEAIVDLKEALKFKPALYEAQIEIAKCYLFKNLPAESIRAIKAAILINPKRPEAYYLRGCIYELKNKTEDALKSFHECLTADSAYHNARISIALIMLIQNKNEPDAIQGLTSVLRLDSLQQDALMMRSILVFTKNKQQSLRDLNNLILVSPGNMIAFSLRAMQRTNLQDYDRAFSDFQTIIKRTSTDDNNYSGQQTWIDKKIDIQNVGAYTLTRVYGLNETDAAKLKKAYCLIMTGSFDKSIAVLNSTSDPREPLTVYLRAVANEHWGRHVEAFHLYNEALALDNTIADAHKKRGIYEQELKGWERSISDFTKVLQLMPESFAIYKFRGVSYHYNNQFDKAIADFTKYLTYDSANTLIIGYRGVSYRANGQRLNAYIDFANSNNREAFRFKDMLHQVDSVLQKGDTTLALAALTTFVKAESSFTEAYALKLKLHVAQNDWPSVERELPIAVNNFRWDTSKADLAFLMTLEGIISGKANLTDDALSSFERAIKADKNYALAYLERGKFLLVKNQKTKAAEDFRKAVLLGNTEAMEWLQKISKLNQRN